ncbi:uncharacterized protein LOC132718732 [Ruditapes philippinarum]|uniref:uncharacterized protein LOC132718732 n=1 Tax=Ruditapes philippinarum TaxID=129788 RepID=UPI00295B9A07|nr:uncharacterized protein LOC132718732 [Ruditapes philippinarum]
MATGSGVSTHNDQLQNPRYKDWVKAGLSLKYFKDGIEVFVDTRLRLQQESLLNVLKRGLNLASIDCDECTLQNLLPHKSRSCGRGKLCLCYTHQTRRTCPNRVCGRLNDQITLQHRYGSPSWYNTDFAKWCSNHWEIGKCYLDRKGYKERTSAVDTDCKGLLDIIINDMFIHGFIDVPIDPPNDYFSKIKTARNEILHSPKLEVTDDALQDLIENMTKALEDKKYLGSSHQAKNAIQKLSLLKSERFIINSHDEMEVRESALNAIREAKEEALECLEDKQAEIMQNIQVDKIKNDIEKLKESVESMATKQTNNELQLKTLNAIEAKQTTSEAEMSTIKHKLSSLSNAQNVLEARLNSVNTAVNTLPTVNARLDSIEEAQRKLDTDVTSFKDIQDHVLVKVKEIQNDILQLKTRLKTKENTERLHQDKIDYLKKKSELQRCLCDLYKKYLSTIPVSPVLEEIDAHIEDIYVALTVTDDLVCKVTWDNRAVPREVHGYADILSKNDNLCKNVYVIGDAGIGKTTWCMKVLRSWSIAIDKSGSSPLSENEQFLSENFDIVLFVSLRLAVTHCNISDMIKGQLFEEYPGMYENALKIIQNEPERCLIICDGFDEWIPQGPIVNQSPLYHADLPGRKDLNGAVIVTTTRPWKLDKIRLSDKHIDRSVTIEGFSTHEKVMTLAVKLIDHLNMRNVSNNNISRTLVNFENDLKASFRLQTTRPTILKSPLLSTYVVCKWYDDGTLGSNVALNYMNIFQFLFDHSEKKYSVKIEQQVKEYKNVPSCITDRPSCVKNTHYLEKLASFAFGAMINDQGKSKLIFSKQDLNQRLSDDDLTFSIKTGIISQSRSVGKILTKECRLTFLHKSIQEFLSALHIVYEIGNDRTEAVARLFGQCSSKSKLDEYENIILLTCGLDRKSSSVISTHLADIADSELKFNKYRVPSTLDLIIKCAEEVDSSKNESFGTQYRKYVIKTHMIYFGTGNSTELLKRMDSLFECNKENITTVDLTICFESNVQDKLERKQSFCSILRNIPKAVLLRTLKIENTSNTRGSDVDIGKYLLSFKDLIYIEEIVYVDEYCKPITIDLSSSRKLTKLVLVVCLDKLVINSILCMELMDVKCLQSKTSQRDFILVYISSGMTMKKLSICNLSSSKIIVKTSGLVQGQQTTYPNGMKTSRLENVNVGFYKQSVTKFGHIYNIDIGDFHEESLESQLLGVRIRQRTPVNLQSLFRLFKEFSDDGFDNLNRILSSLPCLEMLEVKLPGFLIDIGQLQHLKGIKTYIYHIAELQNFFTKLHHAKGLNTLEVNIVNLMFRDKEMFCLQFCADFNKTSAGTAGYLHLYQFLIQQSDKCNTDDLIDIGELKKAYLDVFTCSQKKSQLEAYISTVYFRYSDFDTASMRSLLNLTTLKLGGVTQDMFIRIGEQFQFLPHLSKIELNGLLWLYIDAERVFGCLKTLVSLRYLTVRNVSHACYRAIGAMFSHLRYLHSFEVEEIGDRLCPVMLKQIPDIFALRSLTCWALSHKHCRVLANVLKKMTHLENFSCGGFEEYWYGYMYFEFNLLKSLKQISISKLDIELDQWHIFEKKLPTTKCTVKLNDVSVCQDDVVEYMKCSSRLTSQCWEAVGPYVYSIQFIVNESTSHIDDQ